MQAMVAIQMRIGMARPFLMSPVLLGCSALDVQLGLPTLVSGVAPSAGSSELLPGETNPVVDWIKAGPTRTPRGLGTLVRLPLLHDEVPFGALEAVVPGGPSEHVAHAILGVVAGILAPLLAATELSQDLASEVAARTRELEAQRNFAARIIDSLPVGLYVIDSNYVIRAWNRKRCVVTRWSPALIPRKRLRRRKRAGGLIRNTTRKLSGRRTSVRRPTKRVRPNSRRWASPR